MAKAYEDGLLKFFGNHTGLADLATFAHFLKRSHKGECVVYAKRPRGGPDAVLSYLSRYKHCVAISNRRLVATDQHHVAFRYKDYRVGHAERWKTMRLTPHEFIRRFLSHVLPKGFHRIRHYGLLANGTRAVNVAKVRELLGARKPEQSERDELLAAKDPDVLPQPCPCYGGQMRIIEVFAKGCEPKNRPWAPPETNCA